MCQLNRTASPIETKTCAGSDVFSGSKTRILQDALGTFCTVLSRRFSTTASMDGSVFPALVPPFPPRKHNRYGTTYTPCTHTIDVGLIRQKRHAFGFALSPAGKKCENQRRKRAPLTLVLGIGTTSILESNQRFNSRIKSIFPF